MIAITITADISSTAVCLDCVRASVVDPHTHRATAKDSCFSSMACSPRTSRTVSLKHTDSLSPRIAGLVYWMWAHQDTSETWHKESKARGIIYSNWARLSHTRQQTLQSSCVTRSSWRMFDSLRGIHHFGNKSDYFVLSKKCNKLVNKRKILKSWEFKESIHPKSHKLFHVVPNP